MRFALVLLTRQLNSWLFLCYTSDYYCQEILNMAGGRPTDYKPEYCEAVIKHMESGASLTSFAAEINCARSTINVWMECQPEFSEAVKIAKSKCAAWWERLGRSGASGEAQVNPTLVIFGLKNMAADDWREKQEIDHTTNGKDMTPVVTVAFDDSKD